VNVGTMRGLVEQGRSQGILVYDDGTPVGWCQFVPKDELRFTKAAASGAAWFVTCFVIDPRYRGSAQQKLRCAQPSRRSAARVAAS
jgi:hypothetical protein